MQRGFASQLAFAQAAEIPVSTLNRIETGQFGRKVALDTFLRIAEALGAPLSLILDEVTPENALIPEPPGVHAKLDRLLALAGAESGDRGLTLLDSPPGPTVSVGLFGRSAAGYGTENEPRAEPEEWLEVPAKYKPKNGKLIATRVTGDSMEPELMPGDIVVAEYPERQPAMRLLKEGALVVVTTDQWEDYVKRFHFDKDAQEDTLVSTNPAYGPIPVPSPKVVRFVGIVKLILKGGK